MWRLVLRPQTFDDEILTFAVRIDGSWAGAIVDGQDMWTTHRLVAAREYWTFDHEAKRFFTRAGAYVLRLDEVDLARSAWEDESSEWTWEGGKIVEAKGDAILEKGNASYL